MSKRHASFKLGSEPRLCDVCRRAPSSRMCPICGRNVCSDDYDGGTGLCILCRDTLCAVCRQRLSIASCEVCGRPICDQCSVEVTPVVRLCPDCARQVGTETWPPLSLVRRDLEVLRESLRDLLRVPRRNL